MSSKARQVRHDTSCNAAFPLLMLSGFAILQTTSVILLRDFAEAPTGYVHLARSAVQSSPLATGSENDGKRHPSFRWQSSLLRESCSIAYSGGKTWSVHLDPSQATLHPVLMSRNGHSCRNGESSSECLFFRGLLLKVMAAILIRGL